MSKLYINSTIISDKVRTSTPSFEGENIITHRLLNGKKVIQHIGELSQIIEVSCIVDEINKEILDKAFSEVSMITLQRYNDFYRGYISEYPSFESFNNSLDKARRSYIATFTLDIEGDD